MRNEYRIVTYKGEEDHIFVEVRYWWFPVPFAWFLVSAHRDWYTPGDDKMQRARDSALEHAATSPEKAVKNAVVQYLGRLP